METAVDSINPSKASGDDSFELPEDALWLDGEPITDLDAGGVIQVPENGYDEPTYYSVTAAWRTASPETPPAGEREVVARRVGKICFRDEPLETPTFGSEHEVVIRDPETGEKVLSGLGNETYQDQAEFKNDELATTPEAVRTMHLDIVRQATRYAAEQADPHRPLLAVPLSVFNNEPVKSDLTNNPYFLATGAMMTERTGFETYQVYRVGSVQMHVGTGKTEHMLPAISAMQLLIPILTAPSTAGPFLHGGMAEHLGKVKSWEEELDQGRLSQKQYDHLVQTGLTPIDFRGPHHTYRPALRALSADDANVHSELAPYSKEEYLERSHQYVSEGRIVNSDRLLGAQGDRARVILDGNGANTIELCNFDTFLGNPVVIPEMQILADAIVHRMVGMSEKGEDPFAFTADRLNIKTNTPEDALALANHTYLRHTAVFGNDAKVYGRQPIDWAKDLLAFTDLDKDAYTKSVVLGAFALNGDAATASQKWAQQNNLNRIPRAGEVYYATGVGSPSIHMIREHAALSRTRPDLSLAEVTREVERGIGHDYMALGEQVA